MLSGVKLLQESDADTIRGTGARAHTFTNDRHGGTESKKNKNKKVIELYWPRRSAYQNDWLYL